MRRGQRRRKLEVRRRSAKRIVGIRTVKSLALEPQRRAQWDERVAEAGESQLAFGKLANWPQTLVTPIERMMRLGTMMIGAYLAMSDTSGYMVGGLFAFMMLGGRVAQPLVGLARLVEDYEEVRAAIGQAGYVLNRPLEVDAPSGGLRPQFAGRDRIPRSSPSPIPARSVPALDRVSFSVPAGTMLGVVGRSGSGKSTIARLLQGINREYSGFVKIDGVDLREINLRHLRQNFGVVLQDNFLFRGSIRDNIIAGRPGLRDGRRGAGAARLAGAEEFIERMPNGYNTYIEEGSPNLSGGQKQRLAIARALIHDPAHPHPRRGDERARSRERGGRQRQSDAHRARTHDGDRFASAVVADRLRPDSGAGAGQDSSTSRRTTCCSSAARVYRQLWMQQNRHLDGQGVRPAPIPPEMAQSN